MVVINLLKPVHYSIIINNKKGFGEINAAY